MLEKIKKEFHPSQFFTNSAPNTPRTIHAGYFMKPFIEKELKLQENQKIKTKRIREELISKIKSSGNFSNNLLTERKESIDKLKRDLNKDTNYIDILAHDLIVEKQQEKDKQLDNLYYEYDEFPKFIESNPHISYSN